MRVLIVTFILTVLGLNLSCQWFGTQYPDTPGVLFLRQQVCDIEFVQKAFLLNPQNHLRDQGFTTYHLYRDSTDPKTYLFVLRCKDLKKAVAYFQSSGFHAVCVGAGLGVPVLWAGEDVFPLVDDKSKDWLGLLVRRTEVLDYGSWKYFYDQKHKGQTAGTVGFYRLFGKPTIALEEERILGAPSLSAGPLGLQNAGVLHQEVWCGICVGQGSLP